MVPATIQSVNRDTLTVIDNRTGASFEVPIADNAVRAADLSARFNGSSDGSLDGSLAIYDPGFSNTASCASAITNIHVEPGILEHRGYSIESLCEHSTYTELAYLLIYGELPNEAQYEQWKHEISVQEVRARERQELHAGFSLRRAPDDDARGVGRCPVQLLR